MVRFVQALMHEKDLLVGRSCDHSIGVTLWIERVRTCRGLCDCGNKGWVALAMKGIMAFGTPIALFKADPPDKRFAERTESRRVEMDEFRRMDGAIGTKLQVGRNT